MFNDCLISVDGTDFEIDWPPGNRKSWFSHKFRRAALRYEIGVGILNGDIVWVNGPFPAGDWPDINIFCLHLKNNLDVHERVEADDGYTGEAPLYVKCPSKDLLTDDEGKQMKQRVRCRHETLNGRFKSWKCLSKQWRHDVMMHSWTFHAVSVLTQISINYGKKLFDTNEYRDPN